MAGTEANGAVGPGPLFERLVGEQREQARRAGYVMDLRRAGVQDRRILSAMERVPRHLFVPQDLVEFAYADRALPIACGQMIDRPSLAGRILGALAVEPGLQVLEVGTGSGWTAAVLALLGARVLSVERYPALATAALERLAALKLSDVTVEVGDGCGVAWPEASFDRIVATGSVTSVPAGWRRALKAGGLIVVPVGPGDQLQTLTHVARSPIGDLESSIGPIRAVPLDSGPAFAT